MAKHVDKLGNQKPKWSGGCCICGFRVEAKGTAVVSFLLVACSEEPLLDFWQTREKSPNTPRLMPSMQSTWWDYRSPIVELRLCETVVVLDLECFGLPGSNADHRWYSGGMVWHEDLSQLSIAVFFWQIWPFWVTSGTSSLWAKLIKNLDPGVGAT